MASITHPPFSLRIDPVVETMLNIGFFMHLAAGFGPETTASRGFHKRNFRHGSKT